MYKIMPFVLLFSSGTIFINPFALVQRSQCQLNSVKTPPISPLTAIPNASVRVSPLSFTAMTFGKAHSERYGKRSKEDAFQILDHVYSEGRNSIGIDTANAYCDGKSEI